MGLLMLGKNSGSIFRAQLNWSYLLCKLDSVNADNIFNLEFFRCLAICYIVLPESEESPKKIRYQVASPGEASLDNKSLWGNVVSDTTRRIPTMIYVRESHVEKMGKMDDVAYEIFNVMEFNKKDQITISSPY
ncbi:hypothetical protein ACFE04_021278 [Oxalis oulophora]